RFRIDAQTVLSPIEGTPSCPMRIAIGYNHLRQTGTIQHGTDLALVLVADRVQDQTHARMDTEAKAPVLPAHLMAVDLKTARALPRWLGGPFAHVMLVDGGEVAALAPRIDAPVFQFDDFLVRQVHDHG